MNRIMNTGGGFHNLQKQAKMAILKKKTGGQKKPDPKGVDPTPPILNEHGAFVP